MSVKLISIVPVVNPGGVWGLDVEPALCKRLRAPEAFWMSGEPKITLTGDIFERIRRQNTAPDNKPNGFLIEVADAQTGELYYYAERNWVQLPGTSSTVVQLQWDLSELFRDRYDVL